MRNKICSYVVVLLVSMGLLSCSDINYVKSELSGSAKPNGVAHEIIPPTKEFPVKQPKLRAAVLSVLDTQGYIYEENPSTGTIKTEPQPLSEQSESKLFGATYSAKLFIKIASSSVTFNARFNKESNLTMGGQNLKFPEKENNLRKEFFDAINSELGLM